MAFAFTSFLCRKISMSSRQPLSLFLSSHDTSKRDKRSSTQQIGNASSLSSCCVTPASHNWGPPRLPLHTSHPTALPATPQPRPSPSEVSPTQPSRSEASSLQSRPGQRRPPVTAVPPVTVPVSAGGVRRTSRRAASIVSPACITAEVAAAARRGAGRRDGGTSVLAVL